MVRFGTVNVEYLIFNDDVSGSRSRGFPLYFGYLHVSIAHAGLRIKFRVPFRRRLGERPFVCPRTKNTMNIIIIVVVIICGSPRQTMGRGCSAGAGAPRTAND